MLSKHHILTLKKKNENDVDDKHKIGKSQQTRAVQMSDIRNLVKHLRFSFKQSTIFTKHCILDNWYGSKYVFAVLFEIQAGGNSIEKFSSWKSFFLIRKINKTNHICSIFIKLEACFLKGVLLLVYFEWGYLITGYRSNRLIKKVVLKN